MAEGDIWISEFFNDSRYVIGAEVDWNMPGWREVAQKRPPPSETLPLPVYADYRDQTFQDLPPVYQGGGGINVCPALADVFRQFDLVAGSDSRGGAFPIEHYLYDRKTLARTDYSVLVFGGEKADGLIPEESRGLRVSSYDPSPPEHWYVGEIKDGDIAVRASVRSGSDFWFEPKLRSEFFMSDRLVQALQAAGFAQHFKPIRCRVVEFH